MASVVLPVLNEAEAIPWVLERMPPGFVPIVVDNGSADGSGELAAELGAAVVLERRPGFGAACWAGLLASPNGIVCFMDCDGSLDPGFLPQLVEPIESGAADLVLGARKPLPGAWPWHARAANKLIARELRRRAGVRLSDLGPMRAAHREGLLALGLEDRRFGWPLEMVIKAAASGWRIAELPVPYLPRRGGKSKVSGSVKGTVRAIADMSAVLR
jgi:glycosyltransferase involved in cell wall biosynthesis